MCLSNQNVEQEGKNKIYGNRRRFYIIYYTSFFDTAP